MHGHLNVKICNDICTYHYLIHVYSLQLPLCCKKNTGLPVYYDVCVCVCVCVCACVLGPVSDYVII